MQAADRPSPSRAIAGRVLQWAVHLAAAAVGMYYSYDFGSTIGGPVFGVVLALNGALFCSIVAGALIEQVARLRSATGPGRHRHSPG